MFVNINMGGWALVLSILCLLVGCGGDSSGSNNSSGGNNTVANSAGDGQLGEELEKIRARYDVPGMAAFIVDNSSVVESMVIGKRSQAADQLIQTDDFWHIGSLTKSMTATLAGVLVDEGLIRWDSTIAEVFPEFQDTMLPKYQTLQLQQFLSMTSGMTDDFDNPVYAPLDFTASEVAQRKQGVQLALSYDQERPVGEFHYANANYIIAGAMLEQVAQQDWQTLLDQKLLSVLNIDQFGLGAPGIEGMVDQPLGHRLNDGIYEPVFDDNFPIYSPAGRLHISLADMATYVMFHLRGLRGEGTLLDQATFSDLYRPRSNANYALGWSVNDGKITHSGSNNLWFAVAAIDPISNLAVFAVVNAGGGDAQRATEEVLALLNTRINNAR